MFVWYRIDVSAQGRRLNRPKSLTSNDMNPPEVLFWHYLYDQDCILPMVGLGGSPEEGHHVEVRRR